MFIKKCQYKNILRNVNIKTNGIPKCEGNLITVLGPTQTQVFNFPKIVHIPPTNIYQVIMRVVHFKKSGK